MDVPDAPWIREAENWGMPPYDEIKTRCPECGEEDVETYYIDGNNNIVGCEHCISSVDACEWEEANKEEHEE